MAKKGWVCEGCLAAYTDKKTALDCEQTHREREKSARVRGFVWDQPVGGFGDPRLQYPMKVVVDFGPVVAEKKTDFAVYTLEQIGGLLP